jgi:NAD(P)H dehydrogenase (quinone)
MRFLVVYAHPLEGSFQSALHRRVVNTLTGAGHEVDDCDLYAERFQPVLGAQERSAYHDVDANRGFAPRDVERLLRCQGLVLVFPAWWFGMPAILKGWFDRVWVPGVAFELQDGRTRPLLHHIVRFAVVTTYGSPWWLIKLMGDPNRRVLRRGICPLLARGVRTLWLASYNMDVADAASRNQFLQKVERRMQTLGGPELR